jgi:hypothetical protein
MEGVARQHTKRAESNSRADFIGGSWMAQMVIIVQTYPFGETRANQGNPAKTGQSDNHPLKFRLSVPPAGGIFFSFVLNPS